MASPRSVRGSTTLTATWPTRPGNPCSIVVVVGDWRRPSWSADKAEGMTRWVGVDVFAVELRCADRKDALAGGGHILHHDVEVKLLRDGGVRPGGPAVLGRELERKAGRGIVGGNDDPVVAAVGNGCPSSSE